MHKPQLQHLLFPSLSHIYSTHLNLKNKETNKKNHVFYSKYCKTSSWTLRTNKDAMTEILKKDLTSLINLKISLCYSDKE